MSKECQKVIDKLLTQNSLFVWLKRKKEYYVYIKNEHESSLRAKMENVAIDRLHILFIWFIAYA